jgi:hypothetical protein
VVADGERDVVEDDARAEVPGDADELDSQRDDLLNGTGRTSRSAVRADVDEWGQSRIGGRQSAAPSVPP